ILEVMPIHGKGEIACGIRSQLLDQFQPFPQRRGCLLLGAQFCGRLLVRKNLVLAFDGLRVKVNRLAAGYRHNDSREEHYKEASAKAPALSQTKTHLNLFHGTWDADSPVRADKVTFLPASKCAIPLRFFWAFCKPDFQKTGIKSFASWAKL